ncbi:MAG: MerR family transcriptional regulator [Acidithiobacillus sp.]|nr:MerR family transcriptional regulator [Candidatus Igneacidithiobacillus taiwanensis]MCE5359697.1 MerR family transcriptional regulator [Acidithiobacillus sp.]
MAMESGNRAKAGKALAALPEIPEKQYFSISEAAELCGVKAHVLRYWEQEFPQLKPVKRRGNRRYYQKHDLLLVRQIRSLLYGEGFTIHGARERIGQRPGPSELEISSQLLLDIDNGASVDSRQQTWAQRLLFLRQEVEALRRLCAGQRD